MNRVDLIAAYIDQRNRLECSTYIVPWVCDSLDKMSESDARLYLQYLSDFEGAKISVDKNAAACKLANLLIDYITDAYLEDANIYGPVEQFQHENGVT